MSISVGEYSRQNMIEAMKEHAKGHIKKHCMNVEIYLKNAAGASAALNGVASFLVLSPLWYLIQTSSPPNIYSRLASFCFPLLPFQ